MTLRSATSAPRSNGNTLAESLTELWRYRELLLILVQRDLKARYKNSALGFIWSLVNPLVQVLTITFAIEFMLGSDSKNYSAYVLCAMLPWLFFSTGIMDASPSLLFYYNLIRRTYFPRELVPLSFVCANLIHFLLSTSVFLVYLLVLPLVGHLQGHPPDFPILPTAFLLPIPILGLVLLVTGISLFVSVWTLHFEDMRYIADSLLKVMYWLVPVMYFPEMIKEKIPGPKGDLIYNLYMLNPLSGLLTAFRKLTLQPEIMPGSRVPTQPMGATEWGFLAIALLTSTLIVLLGLRYFNTQKWKLAERA